MAITIDWGNTNVISVPQADLTLVSGALYDFDTEAFREELIALEDDEEGMPWPRTHIHNTQVTVAGVTYARFIEILSPYSVTFEDTGSAYAVRFVGSNNNIFDVENGILNPTDKVSYIPTNSAGLIIAETGVSGLTPTESQALLDIDTNVDALTIDVAALLVGQTLTNEQAEAEHITDPVSHKLILRNTTTMNRWEANAWEDAARLIPYRGRIDGIDESGGLEAVEMLVSVAWS